MKTKKILIASLIAIAFLLGVSAVQATNIYNVHYEDFNDQAEGDPENPLDVWYTYTNETFDLAYVDNVSMSAAKVFNVTETAGDGATINYLNFTVVDPQRLDYFEFHFATYAYNKTNKELILNLSDTEGNVIGLFTLHTNQTKMNLSLGDTIGSEATCTAATEYIVNFSINWEDEIVNATIVNLTGVEKVAVETDNTTSWMNFTNEPKLGLISLYTDDNSTVFFDNFVFSGLAYEASILSPSVLSELAMAFVPVMLGLFLLSGFFRLFSRLKIF